MQSSKTLLDELIEQKLKDFSNLREEIRQLVQIRKEIQESAGDSIEQSSRKTNRSYLS